jgi:hypothetical protein
MSIPFHMFDKELSAREANAARKMESIYHKGQDKIWDGKEILQELSDKHGVPNLSDKDKLALVNIFSLILWGELAAWNISAQLAAEIEPMEAKLAATSQAHDEARHFYVMYDYLDMIDCEPRELTASAHAVLNSVMSTKNLAHKLLGMQLMVEPVAISIFRLVRKTNVEPLLCELLEYYEKDESRHIALGIQYLPTLIRKMRYHEVALLLIWQMRIFLLELDGLKELQNDFNQLGLSSDEVFSMAEDRQLQALRLMGDELGIGHYIWEPLRKLVRIKKEISMADASFVGYIKNVIAATRDAIAGE